MGAQALSRGRVAVFGAIFATWSLTSPPVAATPWLTDRLEFENETTNMWAANGKWLEVPRSEKLQEMRRAEKCSARGGPKPRWRVGDGKLWLVGFYRCAGDVPLEAVYDNASGPMFAEWITAELVTERGPLLCNDGPYGLKVYATTVRLKAEDGIVKDITRVSNADHPRVPKEKTGKGVPRCLRTDKAESR